VAGSCEYRNESSGTIKGLKFLNELSDELLKKDIGLPSWTYVML